MIDNQSILRKIEKKSGSIKKVVNKVKKNNPDLPLARLAFNKGFTQFMKV